MNNQSELTSVRQCQGIDLAQIYKAKLEAMGIPVLLKYESAGPIYGITIDGLGQVRVLVPSEFAADAELLLTDLADEQGWDDGEGKEDDAAAATDLEWEAAEETAANSVAS